MSKAVAVLGIVASLVLGVLYSLMAYENQRLKTSETLYAHQVQLLRDQVNDQEITLRDYQERMRSAPTYEEGYKAGTVRSDGFQAAIKIIKEGSYVDGYHAAIQQSRDDAAFLINQTGDLAKKGYGKE